MKKLLVLTIAAAALTAFTPQETTVKKFSWLEGTWKHNNRDAFEQWQVFSDSLIQGGSFYRKGKDYVRAEDITVSVVNGELFYTPLVYGQNNNKPVPFKIVSYTDTSFVAENSAHTYPQRIVYVLATPVRMEAYIEGDVEGANRRISFSFTRE
jgi:hypothetical protein